MSTTVSALPSTRAGDLADTASAGQTRAMLTCGVAAGPIFWVIAAGQIATRDGFDLSRHALSLLSNGPWGWVQISNFMVTGILVVAAARGARRALRPGRGATWGPMLLAAHGVALFGAGVFRADPSDGFPAGTPAGMPETISWHGIGHAVAFVIAMLTVIAACLVFARGFAARQQRAVAIYSAATGLLIPALLVAPAPVGFGIRAATVQVFLLVWIAVVSASLLRDRRPASTLAPIQRTGGHVRDIG